MFLVEAAMSPAKVAELTLKTDWRGPAKKVVPTPSPSGDAASETT
jgi:hypothetical protein